MRISIAIICLLVCNSIVKGQDNIEKDLGALFNKYEINGSFVLFNQSENKYIRHNSTFCDSGFIPASTFKIPNALIALEEKVITDTLQVIKWDGREHPVSQWNRDQTLKTAIKYSCVWAFVNIATQIETETYKKYIQKFRYGNQDIKGLSNRFWLQGKLRISANQQVEFLRKMYNYKLPVSRNSVDIVKNCIVLKKTANYTISGKTGGGVLPRNKHIMWLVGYLEKDGKTYFYALNFVSNDFNKHAGVRFKLVKDILREFKLI